jgi:leucyl-tRNA synthetase
MLVVQVPAQETEVIQAAKADVKVAPYLEQKTLIRTVYVPNKLVNFVVK